MKAITQLSGSPREIPEAIPLAAFSDSMSLSWCKHANMYCWQFRTELESSSAWKN
jgi:hypothetical protein